MEDLVGGIKLCAWHFVFNHFDEPVLLIEAAWGGHSLVKLFRSRSAGQPPYQQLQQELENAQNNFRNRNEKDRKDDPLPTIDEIKSAYGSSYRNMLKGAEETLASYETMSPPLKGKKLAFAAFVWFQGWNDQYNGAEKEDG